MNADTVFVLVLVAAASILFASGRVRLDIVAILVVIALVLGGVLTEREALAGFGDPVVLLVAGLLIVGEMLTRSPLNGRRCYGRLPQRGGRLHRTAGQAILQI